jgi:hypothetical protein
MRAPLEFLPHTIQTVGFTWLARSTKQAIPRRLGRPAYKYAVETSATPGGILEEWANQTAKLDLQIELRVQAAVVDPADWHRAMRAAEFLSTWVDRQRDDVPLIERRGLGEPVVEVLEGVLSELSPAQLRVLADLYEHMNRRAKSMEMVKRGLALDWSDRELQERALRFKMKAI